MFLYDKKENSLDVYDFTASKDNLLNFRTEQMKQIPEEERIVMAETHIDSYGETPLFEEYTGIKFNNEILSAEYADNEERKNNDPFGRYHVLKNDTRSARDNEFVMDFYICGLFADKRVVQIQYQKMMKYYLLRRKGYDYLGEGNDGKDYRMEEIIQLPKSLYLLQLLEQGRFALLDGEDITEQLALYTLTKIYEVSFEELQKMDNCGITENAYSKTRYKADSDRHILKLLKK